MDSWNLSREKTIANWWENEISEKTFMGCSLAQPTVDRAVKQLRRKLSVIGTKQPNLRKFSPSKVYLLYGLTCILDSLSSKIF